MSKASHPYSGRTEPRRILVRGVNWLGDAVITTPALKRLRERFPPAEIVLVTPSKLVDIWQHHPAINRVIEFSGSDGAWSVGRRLRSEQADLALILPNSTRSAIEPWIARIPARVGYSGAWRSWLLTQVVPPRLGRVRMEKRSATQVRRLRNTSRGRTTWPVAAHQIHEYLNLVSALGASAEPLAPFLFVDHSEVRTAAEKFGLTGALPGARPMFALNPGAEYGPAKRWPIERFTEAAIELHRHNNCVWLITGGPADTLFAARIEKTLSAASVPLVNLVGRTSLRELCAVLCLCQTLLTNDTGPMHVGAAVGIPVVALFGSTAPELTGPGLPADHRHQVLTQPNVSCAPCFRRVCPIDFPCMRSLDIDRVVQAVLSASASRKSCG